MTFRKGDIVELVWLYDIDKENKANKRDLFIINHDVTGQHLAHGYPFNPHLWDDYPLSSDQIKKVGHIDK